MAITSLPTWGEQLKEVLSAISAVRENQRYEINGRSVQRADLEWIHKERIYLIEMIQLHGADAVVGSTITRGACAVNFNA